MEKKIEGRFRKWCSLTPNTICVKLNLQGNKGWPDVMVLLPEGKVLFIEFKAPGAMAYPLQQYVHRELVALGHKVMVTWSDEEAKRFVERELAA